MRLQPQHRKQTEPQVGNVMFEGHLIWPWGPGWINIDPAVREQASDRQGPGKGRPLAGRGFWKPRFRNVRAGIGGEGVFADHRAGKVGSWEE